MGIWNPKLILQVQMFFLFPLGITPLPTWTLLSAHNILARNPCHYFSSFQVSDWWSVCCTVMPVPVDERVPPSLRTCSWHFTPERYFSFGVSAPGLSSRAGRGAKMSPVAPPAPTQHKVVVGGGAHGIKHVGFIWDLELWGRERKRRGEEVWQFVFREPTLASAVVITVIS